MIDSKNIENLKNGTITSLESYICNLIDRNFRTIGNKLLEHKFLLRLNSLTESYVNIEMNDKINAIGEALTYINENIKTINPKIALNLSVSATFEDNDDKTCLITITPSEA